MIQLSSLQGEEKQLLARLEDLLESASRTGRPRYSNFLNERQALIAEELIRQRGAGHCLLHGGYPDALRRVLGAFPDYQEPEADWFPIRVVSLHLPKTAKLSHRDVLGSLMGLQIKRESIGDILLTGHRCDVFLLEPVAKLVLEELVKVGSTGVRCEPGTQTEYRREESFKEIRGTVKSMRLDALVALVTGVSREKSAGLIRTGLVQCNHSDAPSVSRECAPGDVITVRKYGKFVVDQVGAPTKKGRLPVECRKYI